MWVAIEVHPLAGRGEEVDDFGERDVEHRPGLRARRDERVEVDRRGGEVDAEIARRVADGVALDQLALDEVAGADRGRGLPDLGAFENRAHAVTPRT